MSLKKAVQFPFLLTVLIVGVMVFGMSIGSEEVWKWNVYEYKGSATMPISEAIRFMEDHDVEINLYDEQAGIAEMSFHFKSNQPTIDGLTMTPKNISAFYWVIAGLIGVMVFIVFPAMTYGGMRWTPPTRKEKEGLE